MNINYDYYIYVYIYNDFLELSVTILYHLIRVILIEWMSTTMNDYYSRYYYDQI